jgi:rubrerythrin
MITPPERIMLAADFSTLRTLWIFRARAESGRIANDRAWMIENGYEEVEAAGGAVALEDGREILRTAKKAWALRMDVHTERLSAALRSARKEPSAGEGLAAVLCPACKSAMAKSPVCPNCSKGKAGFKILCICTECNHEVYL